MGVLRYAVCGECNSELNLRVHRDLKPANVILTESGQAKIPSGSKSD